MSSVICLMGHSLSSTHLQQCKYATMRWHRSLGEKRLVASNLRDSIVKMEIGTNEDEPAIQSHYILPLEKYCTKSLDVYNLRVITADQIYPYNGCQHVPLNQIASAPLLIPPPVEDEVPVENEVSMPPPIYILDSLDNGISPDTYLSHVSVLGMPSRTMGIIVEFSCLRTYNIGKKANATNAKLIIFWEILKKKLASKDCFL
uniref:Uncharacterized protein n=1 Tax=Chenopodium quinoa TaxID=63459 RepID=A0A803MYE8_CHEQI